MAHKKYNFKLKGYVGGYNFDPSFVDYKLDQLKDSAVLVKIDSLGGDVGAALSVSESFKNHGNVSVHFVGLNASASTISSMGAKHVSIEPSGMYLVHKCSSFVFEWASLNADQIAEKIKDLEAQKNDLNKFDWNIATMYSGKCKKKKEDLLALMKEGAWLTAQEALDWGFVDEITSDESTSSEPVLTASAANILTENGYPLPKLTITEDNNMFSQFMNRLSGLFNISTPNNTLNFMNKKLAILGALLNIPVFEAKEDKYSLTADQLQTIEDDLLNKDTKIKELNALIADLKRKPAEDTTTVVDTADTHNNDFFDTVEKAKELNNLIP